MTCGREGEVVSGLVRDRRHRGKNGGREIRRKELGIEYVNWI